VLLVAVVALALNWPGLVAWREFRQQLEALGENEQGLAKRQHCNTETLLG